MRTPSVAILAQEVSNPMSQLVLTTLVSCGSVFFSWLVSGPRAQPCVCDCTTNVDIQILAVLQRQLDRCGPEQLVHRHSDPGGVLGFSTFLFVPILVAAGLIGLAIRKYRASSGEGRAVDVRSVSSHWAAIQDDSPRAPRVAARASIVDGDEARWTPSADSGARLLRRGLVSS